MTYIPRKTFPTTEEKIARYFDSIKKVPSSSSSALSSSSGSSKRKRRSDDEKTPRRSPNKYRPRRRRHGANIITSYVTSITNPRGEQQDEPSPSSTQSSHDPISSAQVTEDLPSRVARSQGQAPAQMPLPPKKKIFKPPARKEAKQPASFKNSRLGASIDPYHKFSPKELKPPLGELLFAPSRLLY